MASFCAIFLRNGYHAIYLDHSQSSHRHHHRSLRLLVPPPQPAPPPQQPPAPQQPPQLVLTSPWMTVSWPCLSKESGTATTQRQQRRWQRLPSLPPPRRTAWTTAYRSLDLTIRTSIVRRGIYSGKLRRGICSGKLRRGIYSGKRKMSLRLPRSKWYDDSDELQIVNNNNCSLQCIILLSPILFHHCSYRARLGRYIVQ